MNIGNHPMIEKTETAVTRTVFLDSLRESHAAQSVEIIAVSEGRPIKSCMVSCEIWGYANEILFSAGEIFMADIDIAESVNIDARVFTLFFMLIPLSLKAALFFLIKMRPLSRCPFLYFADFSGHGLFYSSIRKNIRLFNRTSPCARLS